jgi:hypothetical protein
MRERLVTTAEKLIDFRRQSGEASLDLYPLLRENSRQSAMVFPLFSEKEKGCRC